MKRVSFSLFIIILVFVSTQVRGTETKLVVRVKAKDAKFIGTSMGGAQIVVRDGETGKILASGLTSGGTGNTKILMKESLKRGVLLSDESAAKFETSININEPTLVTIEAQAPMAQKQSSIKSSTQVWLIPGKPIAGDGVIIEVGGFAVNVLMPQTHESIKLNGSSVSVAIKANMVMMWGCPITPGGLWDANNYEVKAIIKHNGSVIGETLLTASGKVSTFEGEVVVSEKGVFELILYGYDPHTGNTGVDKTTFIVTD